VILFLSSLGSAILFGATTVVPLVVASDVQGSAWPESLGLGSALGAQAYRNLRPSLGARLGLGLGLARAGPRLC
jgi:hypothetical protein